MSENELRNRYRKAYICGEVKALIRRKRILRGLISAR